MQFYLPEGSPEILKAKVVELREHGQRTIRSLEYMHDGSRFVVTVGEPRKQYKRETGPRGGSIKNAGLSRIGHQTGKSVNLIIDGFPIYVFSAPGDGWGFPSFVGDGEINRASIEYFDF